MTEHFEESPPIPSLALQEYIALKETRKACNAQDSDEGDSSVTLLQPVKDLALRHPLHVQL